MSITPQQLQIEIQNIKNQIYELQKTSFNNLKNNIGQYIQDHGVIQILISEQENITIDADNYQTIIISNIVSEENIDTVLPTEENNVSTTETLSNNLEELKTNLMAKEQELNELNSTNWQILSNLIVSYINDYDTYLAIQSSEENQYYLPNNLEAYGITTENIVFSVNIININLQNADNIIDTEPDYVEEEDPKTPEEEDDNDFIVIDDTVLEDIDFPEENFIFWEGFQEALYNFLINTNQDIKIYSNSLEEIGIITQNNYKELLRQNNIINFSNEDIVVNSDDEIIA